jgi:hypothetical protein
MLKKEDILAAQDLKTEVVNVPEWGGDVTVRAMSGTARDAWESSMVLVDDEGKRRPNVDNLKAKLVALCMVDETGQQMFTLDEVGHLAGKSALALDRVFQVAQRINGLGFAAEAEATKN